MLCTHSKAISAIDPFRKTYILVLRESALRPDQSLRKLIDFRYFQPTGPKAIIWHGSCSWHFWRQSFWPGNAKNPFYRCTDAASGMWLKPAMAGVDVVVRGVCLTPRPLYDLRSQIDTQCTWLHLRLARAGQFDAWFQLFNPVSAGGTTRPAATISGSSDFQILLQRTCDLSDISDVVIFPNSRVFQLQ